MPRRTDNYHLSLIFGIFMNLFVFLFGLVVGSFLNCVIYRLETKQTFLKGRSFCPYCKQVLKWQDLIPVFSFLILRGKCRYCRKRISYYYPLVELFTAIIFFLIFWHLDFGFDLTFGFWILISSFLIIIFVYDLKHFIIPDKIIYPAIFIALLRTVLGVPPRTVLVAFGAAGFFLLIVLISRGRWMGVGDIKLAFLMGLLLGFPYILVALFFSFLIGAIIGIGLILAKRKTMKSEVPFGPFLVTGTFVVLFLGQRIIQWYLNLFNI